MFTTVLVGADSSETAARAVEAATELVKAIGGTLHVMTAYRAEARPPAPSEIDARMENPADQLLAELKLTVARLGLTAEFHAATGEPAEAIVHVADRIGADLIVVGNRGMKGVRRVLGSVPNSVAHEANCSVLIVDTVGEH